MNVNKWGPSGWIFLHSITFNYPLNPNNQDKINIKNFFLSTANILPCKYCRQSFLIYIKYIPIDLFLESRESLVFWLYKIHQLVNQKIFKPNANIRDVIIKYENMRAKCGTMKRNNDNNKKYKSCQNKQHIIDEIHIQNFIQNTQKYQKIIQPLIKKLYSSNENPNKDFLKHKHYIYNIIYNYNE